MKEEDKSSVVRQDTYDATSIKVLGGIEAVRKKAGNVHRGYYPQGVASSGGGSSL